jgi:hypothetical protein
MPRTNERDEIQFLMATTHSGKTDGNIRAGRRPRPSSWTNHIARRFRSPARRGRCSYKGTVPWLDHFDKPCVRLGWTKGDFIGPLPVRMQRSPCRDRAAEVNRELLELDRRQDDAVRTGLFGE